jgi:hypothetical protein
MIEYPRMQQTIHDFAAIVLSACEVFRQRRRLAALFARRVRMRNFRESGNVKTGFSRRSTSSPAAHLDAPSIRLGSVGAFQRLSKNLAPLIVVELSFAGPRDAAYHFFCTARRVA